MSLFTLLMIIYCLKRFCCMSSDTSAGAPGHENEKQSRGTYIRAATEWDEDSEEFDGNLEAEEYGAA